MEKLIIRLACLWAFIPLQSAWANSDNPPVALLPSEEQPAAATHNTPPAQSALPSDHHTHTAPKTPEPNKKPAGWNDYAKVESMAQNGQANEALKLLETRLSDAPDDAKASYLKGLILMQLGRREAAEQWFLGMRERFPTLPQPYNALAVIYQAQGKLLDAEQILRELSIAHPTQKNVHRNRGEIYLQLAQSAFEKAHQQNPDDAMIKQRLEQLKTMLPPAP